MLTLIYIHSDGKYQEIDCNNKYLIDFILFRIVYINENHYESLYLDSNFDDFSETLITNSCRLTND